MDQLELFSTASDWLRPFSDAMWRWDEEGEAIVWVDGSTLLFREELAQIVERLSGEGLPSANIIMLLMAACRGRYPSVEEVRERMGRILKNADKTGNLLASQGDTVNEKAFEFYSEALSRLRALSKYPPELLTGVAAKTHLVERVAGNLERGETEQAKAILLVLREGLPLAQVLSSPVQVESGNLLGDLYQLHSALGQLNPESLQLSARTGLQSLPEARGIELHPAECIKAFLKELREDPEFSGMARLTRDIMATLSLPRALEHPETQAMGGLSDISNRGPLHRLLISELAHDDDTLAIRVAMNEALYLRNEPPAARPRSALMIVVDAGIRMWGLPRVFATAAAMALVAKSDKTTDLQIFRPTGNKLIPIDLTQRDGLVQHLGKLETNTHPGASLESLPREESLPVDLAIITHGRALRETGFKTALDQLSLRNLYLISVDRDGNLQLDVRTPAGSNTLQRAHLALKDILEEKGTGSLRNEAATLPAILFMHPFPILLPLPDAIEEWVRMSHFGFAAVTKNGAVCRWTEKQRGSTTYPVPLFQGKTEAFIFDDQLKCLILVKYRSSSRDTVLFRWFAERDPDFCTEGKITICKDVPGDPLGVVVRYGLLHIAYLGLVEVIDLETGASKGRFPMGMPYLGEAFYFNPELRQLGLVGWSGTDLHFYDLKLPSSIDPEKIIRVFYPPGKSAWIVDSTGLVASTSDQNLFLKASISQINGVSISRDSCRLWLQGEEKYGVMVDIEKKTVGNSVQSLRADWLNPQTSPPKWSVRIRFTHIAVERSGHIWLRAAKGYWNRIEFDGLKFQLVRHEKGMWPQMEAALAFQSAKAPTTASYHLHSVTWTGGSRAFLDSRGLLHLQSAELDIPELCIVLAESVSLPVWASDGLKAGPEFFMGKIPSAGIDGKAIDEHLRRFIGAIL